MTVGIGDTLLAFMEVGFIKTKNENKTDGGLGSGEQDARQFVLAEGKPIA